MSQASSTLVWYSIAGMLSASVGASMLPVAKYAWERLEHLLAPMQDRERGAQVRLVMSVLCFSHCEVMHGAGVAQQLMAAKTDLPRIDGGQACCRLALRVPCLLEGSSASI